MRAPSVAPRGADVVGSLKVCRGGTAVGETREEGGSFNLKFTPLHSCRGRIPPLYAETKTVYAETKTVFECLTALVK